MALSASSITIDVTKTATKAIAPQNDLFRNVSIGTTHSKFSSLLLDFDASRRHSLPDFT